MIKINLLPSHILEGRKVKGYLRWVIVFLALLTGALAGYVWGPAPFCVGPRKKAADKRLSKANQAFQEAEQIKAEADIVKGRFGEMESWVQWVREADAIPAKWERWYNRLNRYVPADVVVNGFPPPSTNLTFTGYTTDRKAATRWYLNMLRCEMIDGGPEVVHWSISSAGSSGRTTAGRATAGRGAGGRSGGGRASAGQASAADNRFMREQMTISIAIRPDYLDMLTQPAVPAAAGMTSGRGGGGGRMGGGRGGAGAGRRGGGGRGGRRG